MRPTGGVWSVWERRKRSNTHQSNCEQTWVHRHDIQSIHLHVDAVLSDWGLWLCTLTDWAAVVAMQWIASHSQSLDVEEPRTVRSYDVGKAFKANFCALHWTHRQVMGLRWCECVNCVIAKHPVSGHTALYQFSLCTVLSHHMQTPVHFDGFFFFFFLNVYGRNKDHSWLFYVFVVWVYTLLHIHSIFFSVVWCFLYIIYIIYIHIYLGLLPLFR